MESSRKSIAQGLGGMLWCFSIIVLYYVSHKPFSSESLADVSREPLWVIAGLIGLVAFIYLPELLTGLRWRSSLIVVVALLVLVLLGTGLAARLGWLPEINWAIFGENLGILVVVALLVTLGGAVGNRIIGSLPLGPLVSLSVQAALGLGLLALGVLLVGSTLGLSIPALWIGLIILLALLWKQAVAWLRQWAGIRPIWRESGRFERWVGGLIAASFGLALLVALSPPVEFDALMYHLVMPVAYLAQGKVAYLPWLVMTGMPQTAEMLYTWAIGLAGSSAATVLGWCIAVLSVTGLFGLIYRRLGLRPAFVGTAALMCGFTLAVSPSWGYADWMALYFGAASLTCLDIWQQTGDQKSLILAAVFTGMALGTKYPAGVLGLVTFGAVLWGIIRRKQPLWPTLWRYALFAVLPALPWLSKNLLTTGNPLYPFFFVSGAMNQVRLSVYQASPPFGNWLDFFLLPLRATYLGIDATAGYSVSPGPLLLGMGALAWIGQEKREPERRLSVDNAALIAILGLLIWAAGNRWSGFLIQTRFYFALFPAFAFLAATGYEGVIRIRLPKIRLGRLLAALIFLPLSLNLVETGLHTLETGAPLFVFGLKSANEYLAANLGWYYPVMQDVNGLPAGSRVMLLFETRSLYCLQVCLPDEILDRWKRSLTAHHTPTNILAAWKKEGFTHILYYRKGAEFMHDNGDIHMSAFDWQALNQFLATLPAPRDYAEVYDLYQIP